MSRPGRVMRVVCACGRQLGTAELVAHGRGFWWPVDQPPDTGWPARRSAVEHWLVSADTRRDVGTYLDSQVPDDYGRWPVHLQCKACRFDVRIRQWRALYPLLDGLAAAGRDTLTLPVVNAYQRSHPDR